MKFLLYPLWFLWRVWYYAMVLLAIVLLFPFLFYAILSEKRYPLFFKFARIWAKIIFYATGFYYKSNFEQKIDSKQSYMIVANHTSMIDIMILLIVIKQPFVFVGKKELAKIPLFGFFYKRTCVLVDRNSSESRRKVFARVQHKIEQGYSICIFPEGGVPDDESIVLDRFKDGAFQMSINHQMPLLPITLPDNKKRFSYTFFSGSPGLMRVFVHKPIETKNLDLSDRNQLKQQVFDLIYQNLIKYQN